MYHYFNRLLITRSFSRLTAKTSKRVSVMASKPTNNNEHIITYDQVLCGQCPIYCDHQVKADSRDPNIQGYKNIIRSLKKHCRDEKKLDAAEVASEAEYIIKENDQEYIDLCKKIECINAQEHSGVTKIDI